MKKVSLFLVVAGLTTMVAFGQKKEIRTVSGFTGINASSVFDITVTKGSTESLTIETEEGVMPYVRSEVRNGVLHLYLDNGNRIKNIKTLKASVVMKDLDKVLLSGTCKLTANDLFTSAKFTGDCSGVSNLTVNVNTDQLNINASGACNVQLRANVTGNANLDVSGTSKIHGDLKAVHVKFNSSGVSSTELTGSASDIKIDISGTAKIKGENFEVQTASVESSGTSAITLNVTDVLKVNSSGASTVNYTGTPVIEAKAGGVSKVRRM